MLKIKIEKKNLKIRINKNIFGLILALLFFNILIKNYFNLNSYGQDFLRNFIYILRDLFHNKN